MLSYIQRVWTKLFFLNFDNLSKKNCVSSVLYLHQLVIFIQNLLISCFCY